MLFIVPVQLTYCQQIHLNKVRSLYDSLIAYDIESPGTVLSVAIFETGWMQCKKCTLSDNNLFGFRNNDGYVKFESVSACLAYLKTWQDTFYKPYKRRHPRKSYYDFLVHIRYAYDMTTYLQTIKSLDHWVSENIVANRAQK